MSNAPTDARSSRTSADGIAPTEPDASEPQTDRAGAPRHPWWRTKRAIILGALGLVTGAALVTTLLIVQHRPEAPDPVAVNVPVALSRVDVPAGVKIGVVITAGQGQRGGSEWALAAEGARVAQYRLAEGGSEVELIVEDDHGTPDGSRAAVAALIEQDVSGIVLATSGNHLSAAVDTAAAEHVPVILPYAPLPDAAEATAAWSFAADEAAISAAMDGALERFDHPVLLDAGPGVPASVTLPETLRISDGDVSALAREAALRSGADSSSHGAYTGDSDDEPQASPDPRPRADAFVLSGSPATLALLVTQLQARNVSLPLVLSPGATSPAFAQALEIQGGTVSASLETVGVDLGDAGALGQAGRARALSAYLQALRQLSDTEQERNLFGDAPFAEVAHGADVRAHDAVLALAIAAGNADQTDPERVADELRALHLTAGAGAAGAELNFSQAQAASEPLVVLHATDQAFGLRPSDGLSVSWFPAPEQRAAQ